MPSIESIDAKGQAGAILDRARRVLRKDQKKYALQSGSQSTRRPHSTLEPTLQALEWRKKLEPTDIPGIVRRGLWKFERELEVERIRLAEDLIRRVDPGPYEDPNYFALLAYQAASIEMAARHLLKGEDQRWSRFLLGTIASANVNAFSKTNTRDDYTIVEIHSALIDFIYQAAKVVIAVENPVRSYDGKSDIRSDFSEEAIRLQLSRDPEPVLRLYRTLEAYFFKGYPRAYANEEVKEESHPPLGLLVSMAERFVIAHEYGHKFAEHLGWQAAEAGNPLWVKEFFADRVAMFATVLSGHTLDHFTPEVSLSGGVFSLACLDILRQGVSILRTGNPTAVSGSDSHPPFHIRAEQVVEEFHRLFHVDYLPGYRGCELTLIPIPKNTKEVDDSIRKHVHVGTFGHANTLFIIWDAAREFLQKDYASGRKLHSMWCTADAST